MIYLLGTLGALAFLALLAFAVFFARDGRDERRATRIHLALPVVVVVGGVAAVGAYATRGGAS